MPFLQHPNCKPQVLGISLITLELFSGSGADFSPFIILHLDPVIYQESETHFKPQLVPLLACDLGQVLLHLWPLDFSSMK